MGLACAVAGIELYRGRHHHHKAAVHALPHPVPHPVVSTVTAHPVVVHAAAGHILSGWQIVALAAVVIFFCVGGAVAINHRLGGGS